jgi:hypothetical protein
LTASLDEVLEGLYDIIAAEGPMPCYRAYEVYRESIGAETMGPRMRSAFNKAVYRGTQRGRLAYRNELGSPGQINNIVRTVGTPPVVLRERGDRTFGDIPPSEVAAALQILAKGTDWNLEDNPEALYSELLRQYGLERLPTSDWQTEILRRAVAVLATELPEAAKQQLSLFHQLEN